MFYYLQTLLKNNQIPDKFSKSLLIAGFSTLDFGQVEINLHDIPNLLFRLRQQINRTSQDQIKFDYFDPAYIIYYLNAYQQYPSQEKIPEQTSQKIKKVLKKVIETGPIASELGLTKSFFSTILEIKKAYNMHKSKNPKLQVFDHLKPEEMREELINFFIEDIQSFFLKLSKKKSISNQRLIILIDTYEEMWQHLKKQQYNRFFSAEAEWLRILIHKLHSFPVKWVIFGRDTLHWHINPEELEKPLLWTNLISFQELPGLEKNPPSNF